MGLVRRIAVWLLGLFMFSYMLEGMGRDAFYISSLPAQIVLWSLAIGFLIWFFLPVILLVKNTIQAYRQLKRRMVTG
jgi:TRAP-type C4-dicarboxylate transport system permease small subunit